MTIPVTLIVRLFDEAGYDVTGPDPQRIEFKDREERAMLWQTGNFIRRDGRRFQIAEKEWGEDGGLTVNVRTRAVKA